MDWEKDYDVFDPQLADDPVGVMAELRRSCPVAHSDRHGGSWWPTRFEDVSKVASDHEHFSSRSVSVAPLEIKGTRSLVMMDPPEHAEQRRLMIDFFSPKNAVNYEPYTRDVCETLARGMSGETSVDAVQRYVRQIPPRVVAAILGIDGERSDEFTEWAEGILGQGTRDPEVAAHYMGILTEFLRNEMEKRKVKPGSDLISELLRAEVNGEPLPEDLVFANLRLMMIAGVDTTWSAIGAAVWHLAKHSEDQARLRGDSALVKSAVEEFLRAYAPATMARIAKCPVTLNGAQIQAGDRVLLSFLAANHDPEKFENPDEIDLERSPNRHVTFGYGVHRCLGASLARMEMRVALEVLLNHFSFELDSGKNVSWSGGQIRGPSYLPLKLRALT